MRVRINTYVKVGIEGVGQLPIGAGHAGIMGSAHMDLSFMQGSALG